jgi:iron complex outermembrane receptor protein
MKFKPISLVLLNLLFPLAGVNVFAQSPKEDKPDYALDAIVVVANRIQNPLLESTTATSVLDSLTLKQLPVRNLAEALQYVPGLTFVDKDGSGNAPIPIVRGFYGGGETEYILLTVDGIPVNDIRSGLADWSQIPISSIKRIEVLRGAGSAVYGDAALGAVVNIVTFESDQQKALSTNLLIGQENKASADVSYQAHFGNQALHLNAYANQSNGFRSHSQWKNIFLKGRYEYEYTSRNLLYAYWNVQRLLQDDPGPLTPGQIAADRKMSNPLFKNDYRHRNSFEIHFGLKNSFEGSNRFSADFGLRMINQKKVRTLLLTPDFGDTQFHNDKNTSFWMRSQYLHTLKSFSFIVGIDADYGEYDSQYFEHQNKDELLSEGFGNRFKAGLYLETHKYFGERLKTNFGLRYDLIMNGFDNDLQKSNNFNFDQWTPRLGLNYAYLTNELNRGHVYANYAHSFKAPTLEQLFDQRQIAVGPQIGFVNFSNSKLRPQNSVNYEIGVYQRITFLKQRLYSELTVSAYRMDLEDEIDFDLNTFSYGNIQKSRHDGFEGAVAIYLLPKLSVSSTLNLTGVTFRSGQAVNNQLKNIPKETLTNVLNINLTNIIQFSVSHKYIGKVFLDDENITTLSGYQTYDSRIRLNLKNLQLYFNVMNIADNKYSSSGYTLYDPGQMKNVKFLFPNQGRYIEAGVEFALFNK